MRAIELLSAAVVIVVTASSEDVQVNADGTTLQQEPFPVSEYTLDEFIVAGVNLASYRREEPYLLFDDWDISDQLTGRETWADLLEIRRTLERPTLSFYEDKIARKRWIPTVGLSQPRLYALLYQDELVQETQGHEADGHEGVVEKILNLLPTQSDFCAKPSHSSDSHANWLVNHDREANVIRYSNSVRGVQNDDSFRLEIVAQSLADSFGAQPYAPDLPVAWHFEQISPGIVVEERWAAIEDDKVPPHEFQFFVLWGKVWLGQWNFVEDQNRWCAGWFHRNGTIAHGPPKKKLPVWLDWSRLVEILEQLARNKDMFRADIFVGVPASVKSLQEGATLEERREALEIGVSECAVYPTTVFPDDKMTEEGTRLWIAGYKMGNYRVVPNTEVPIEFLEKGTLSVQDYYETRSG